MRDEKLRELERQWKETGATEDEVAYLLASVRSGALGSGRLRLAALCGYEAAAMAVGLTGARTEFPEWSEALGECGEEVLRHLCLLLPAALAEVRPYLPIPERTAAADSRSPVLEQASLSVLAIWAIRQSYACGMGDAARVVREDPERPWLVALRLHADPRPIATRAPAFTEQEIEVRTRLLFRAASRRLREWALPGRS